MKTSTRDALLILAIGPSLSTTPFASITDVGYYRDTEDTGWHGSLHLIGIKHFSIVKHLTGKKSTKLLLIGSISSYSKNVTGFEICFTKIKRR
jgi:hypothetical protein